MKRIFPVLSIFFLPAFLLCQSPSEQADVKACIQRLFDGMRIGDSSMVRSVFHPEARMQTVFLDKEGNPQMREGSVDAFVKQIGTPHSEAYDERILSYKIEVDGLLATAWTEYAFYLGEELRHCGTNAFQLFKSGKVWKIIQIIDTRYQDGCEPIPGELATAKMKYKHPIPFAPRNYVCRRSSGRILIDGKLDELDWEKAAWTEDFVDIEGDLKPKPRLRTRAKMLWDDEYFYFAAQIEEPHIWANLTKRDAVVYFDDDFEIFIDPDGDGHNYYEYEMNARNTIWDLLMLWPYHLKRGPNYVFNWNNPGLIAGVHVEGSLNDPSDEDTHWLVEVAFPWSALKELATPPQPPKSGDQWRVNFSRVDWHVEVKNGKYVKKTDLATGKTKREENWVWSPHRSN